MFTKLFSWLGGIFANKLIDRIIAEIKRFIEEIEMEKQIKTKVKDIQNETDAQTRAKRMRDLLNS
jgi:hypothetical protein